MNAIIDFLVFFNPLIQDQNTFNEVDSAMIGNAMKYQVQMCCIYIP